MTDPAKLIARVRELDREATPGPWRADANHEPSAPAYVEVTPHEDDEEGLTIGAVFTGEGRGRIMALATAKPQHHANAELVAEFRTAAVLLADEVERLREANKALHRRCQSAERGLAQNLKKVGDRTLGRALANSAATMYREQLAEARSNLDWFFGEVRERLGCSVYAAPEQVLDRLDGVLIARKKLAHAIEALAAALTASRERERRLREHLQRALDVCEDVLGQFEGEPRKYGEIQVKNIVSDGLGALAAAATEEEVANEQVTR